MDQITHVPTSSNEKGRLSLTESQGVPVAGHKFIDQGRHRHGARHRDGRGQRRPAPQAEEGAGASGGVIKARMAFLEEKGCVSWDISAAPRRSGREYYGNEPK